MAKPEPCALVGCDVTHIYHMTHARNLASIIAEGGLYSHTAMQAKGIGHIDITHQHIQSRRLNKSVPIPPYGVLHDYVPFYFAPRSPMLYAIYKGNVASYQEGQEQVIYLVTTVRAVLDSNIGFVFTDGHAVVQVSAFYNQPGDLNKLDWKVMLGTDWYDTYQDPDRKRRRGAEFLVRNFLPYSLVEYMVVYDKPVAQTLVPIRDQSDYKPPIYVKRNWYF